MVLCWAGVSAAVLSAPPYHSFPTLLQIMSMLLLGFQRKATRGERDIFWQRRWPQLSQLWQPSTASVYGEYLGVSIYSNIYLSVLQACVQQTLWA